MPDVRGMRWIIFDSEWEICTGRRKEEVPVDISSFDTLEFVGSGDQSGLTRDVVERSHVRTYWNGNGGCVGVLGKTG